MTKSRYNRNNKKQMGQFMTPINLAYNIVRGIDFQITDKVLEPSFGDGSFIIVLIDRFMKVYPNDISIQDKLTLIFKNNLWGVELDKSLYDKCINNIEFIYGVCPDNNLICGDFLSWDSDIIYDYIIGNPPFGGSINIDYQEELDKKYGWWNGHKIKKETYSYFIYKCVTSLNKEGSLVFILSDTFLTIRTMNGLRVNLISHGYNIIDDLDRFSRETAYGMVVLKHFNMECQDHILSNGEKVYIEDIEATPNYSWATNSGYVKYFKNDKLGKYIKCHSGITLGKNEYFLRKIEDNKITETFDFEFFDDIIDLESEMKKSHYNKLSKKKMSKIGTIIRNVKITEKEPVIIELPHPDYKYYHKSVDDTLYTDPQFVIYWKDDGDVVKTFKANSKWYLRGMGGKNLYGKEGITWNLISRKIKARYLTKGYIFDAGTPLGVLREGVDKDELYFILGWLLTDLANDILKNVLNHTRNIQGKDVEKLPYPFWVKNKKEIIDLVKSGIKKKIDPKILIYSMNDKFEYKENNLAK